jgi:phosphohistidine phosphatase
MKFYLLRHGLAVEPGTPGFSDDSTRPLTAEGKLKMRRVARGMKSLELSFGLILSSPYIRARQTAEIVADAFKAARRLKLTETLEPGGSTRALVETIRAWQPALESVLVVGHEPYLSGLISLLVSGETGLAIVMKKGGLCRLDVNRLKHGQCAALEWLLAPKQLAGVR